METEMSHAATQLLVVIVEMDVDPQHYQDFMELLKRNAARSLDREDGCLMFDVCAPDIRQDPPSVLLYKVYASDEAFERHLEAKHFKVFDARSRHMVRTKSIRRYRLQAGL